MKIHPDGTLEGTAEELAAYQNANKCGSVGVEANQAYKPLLGSITPSTEVERDSLIRLLGFHKGVNTIELATSSSFDLTMQDRFSGSGVVKGDGRTTILIVKH